VHLKHGNICKIRRQVGKTECAEISLNLLQPVIEPVGFDQVEGATGGVLAEVDEDLFLLVWERNGAVILESI
jgi:hypothetical protein